MEDTQIFDLVLNRFAEQYPNRNICKKWDYDRWIVYVDDEPKFTTEGWNLLYNINRLCKILADELL